MIYKKNVEKKNFIDLFYLEKPISNQFVAQKIRKKNNIIPDFFGRPLFKIHVFLKALKIKILKKNFLDYRIFDRDNHNLLDKTKPSVTFDKAELSQGQKFLSRIGVRDNQKFVLLIARDNAYLKKNLKKVGNQVIFRNSKIENFEKSVQYLIKQGLFIIRVGKLTEKKISN